MHHNGNGGATPPSMGAAAPLPPVDRVCGVGVCDVLRIELEHCQLSSLRREIDELRRVYDDGVAAAVDRGPREDLERLRYEREVLDMVGAEVSATDDSGGRVVVHGPARLVAEIVMGAASNAVDEVATRARRRHHVGAHLAEATRVAAAWVDTYVALQAVESYSFDPDADHVRQW